MCWGHLHCIRACHFHLEFLKEFFHLAVTRLLLFFPFFFIQTYSHKWWYYLFMHYFVGSSQPYLWLSLGISWTPYTTLRFLPLQLACSCILVLWPEKLLLIYYHWGKVNLYSIYYFKITNKYDLYILRVYCHMFKKQCKYIRRRQI